MKHIKIMITALALTLSAAVMAQAEQHKGEAAPQAAGTATPSADHSHDMRAPAATGTAQHSVDHSHEAVPEQRSSITTAPAAKPVGSAHPYQAPAGREAATQPARRAHAAHSGPTAVSRGQGTDAAHQHATQPRPAHSGPAPARATRTETHTPATHTVK
ncbi:MAG: hypothetical protein JST83_16555 [Bacteroidetes bacterium]|nr:hypothetical protein [Bacteroidota bacterium]